MLKNNKFKIVPLIFLLFAGLLLYGLYLYNKKPAEVKDIDADYSLSALKLSNLYSTNEKLADEKYGNKILIVKGSIANIDFENGNGIITLKDANNTSSIICHLTPIENKKALSLKKGSTIKIKGVCTGYLLDVMLDRCVIVN